MAHGPLGTDHAAKGSFIITDAKVALGNHFGQYQSITKQLSLGDTTRQRTTLGRESSPPRQIPFRLRLGNNLPAMIAPRST